MNLHSNVRILTFHIAIPNVFNTIPKIVWEGKIKNVRNIFYSLIYDGLEVSLSLQHFFTFLHLFFYFPSPFFLLPFTIFSSSLHHLFLHPFRVFLHPFTIFPSPRTACFVNNLDSLPKC